MEVPNAMDRVNKTNEQWAAELTAEQYHVLREKGTERPFSGSLYLNKDHGTYHCAACGLPLFDATAKFESGSGWPSFSLPFALNHVSEQLDTSHGMRRTEVTCARCGGHLGHVFPDGPAPTGQRYCINSVALRFQRKGQAGE